MTEPLANPTATTDAERIDAHIQQVSEATAKLEADALLRQAIKNEMAKDRANEIARAHADTDELLDRLHHPPPVKPFMPPMPERQGVIEPFPGQLVPHAPFAASPPFDWTPLALCVGIVLIFLGFIRFARRRLAWFARRAAAKGAAFIRWLRMDVPDEI